VSPQVRILLWILIVFSLLGALFAGISTYDFVAHLDRQVHAITCAFVPGLAARDASGTSGCHAAMMSPYSSVLRTSTWGGIPISLPGLAVFAFLLAFALHLLLSGQPLERADTWFLLAATLLPVVVSAVYFAIAVTKVGAVCKLCIGIYVASLGVLVAAVLLHWRAVRPRGQGATWGRFLAYAVQGVAFVLVPVLLYLALKPAYPQAALAGCGSLLHPEDKYDVRIAVASRAGGIPAIEVMDPLCAACKGFTQRLSASGFEQQLELEVVLFPLDKECNWMVSESLHPGACAVSETILAAGPQAPAVLAWVFDHQEELRRLGDLGAAAVQARVKQEFPEIASNLGKPATKSRLNRSLRWVVSNSLPVLTPQLYVGGEKVCDEDTDLGLEYVLSRLLERRGTAGGGR